MRVIKKVDYSEWASTGKRKTISVCTDFSTGLNEYLRDHTYPLATSEEIFSKLNGGKVFSKIDLSKAYMQVKVKEECTKYLTIHKHTGLYRLRQLLFSLKVTPSLFQQIMDMMLSGLKYAMAYLDNILIKTENFEGTQKSCLEKFLKELRNMDLRSDLKSANFV